MVDRTSRERLGEVIRSYMEDHITAFDLDEELGAIGAATEDKTVQAVVRDLWFYYDDCRDHYVVACKREWDYFNRLLLLLASDAEITIARVRRTWHLSQFVAAVSLAIFVCLAVLRGWGLGLVGLTPPFGVVSMVLAWFNMRRRRRATAAGVALSPFPNFSILRSARRKAGRFVKIPYPNGIADRTIRGRIEVVFLWAIRTPMWFVFSPVVLFVQMLREKHSETAMVVPELC